MFDGWPNEAFAYLSATLFLLLARSRDLTILVKSRKQRTEDEQKEVDRGMLRSIMLEVVVFVPASATLALLVVLPLLESKIPNTRTAYAMVGLVSYGFPFAAMRAIVVRIAQNTLKEFAGINVEQSSDDRKNE